MPLIEVDETEVQRSAQLRRFIEGIRGNKRAWRKLLEAQKEVNPNDPLVKELETVDPADERLMALEKKLADAEAKRQEADNKRETDARIASLQRMKEEGIARLRSQGFMDEGIKGVEKIMEEKGILDPLDAAAIWQRDNPPPAPMASNGIGGWNFLMPDAGDKEDLQNLVKTKGNYEALTDKMAREALSEIRGPLLRR